MHQQRMRGKGYTQLSSQKRTCGDKMQHKTKSVLHHHSVVQPSGVAGHKCNAVVYPKTPSHV